MLLERRTRAVALGEHDAVTEGALVGVVELAVERDGLFELRHDSVFGIQVGVHEHVETRSVDHLPPGLDLGQVVSLGHERGPGRRLHGVGRRAGRLARTRPLGGEDRGADFVGLTVLPDLLALDEREVRVAFERERQALVGAVDDLHQLGVVVRQAVGGDPAHELVRAEGVGDHRVAVERIDLLLAVGQVGEVQEQEHDELVHGCRASKMSGEVGDSGTIARARIA